MRQKGWRPTSIRLFYSKPANQQTITLKTVSNHRCRGDTARRKSSNALQSPHPCFSPHFHSLPKSSSIKLQHHQIEHTECTLLPTRVHTKKAIKAYNCVLNVRCICILAQTHTHTYEIRSFFRGPPGVCAITCSQTICVNQGL